MNRLTTSLFFIFFGVKIALCTGISIYAPAYKNQSITWKKKSDYITNVNEIIAHEIIFIFSWRSVRETTWLPSTCTWRQGCQPGQPGWRPAARLVSGGLFSFVTYLLEKIAFVCNFNAWCSLLITYKDLLWSQVCAINLKLHLCS